MLQKTNLGLDKDISQILAYEDGVNLTNDDIRSTGRNSDVLLNACKDIGLAVNTGKIKYMEIGDNRGEATLQMSISRYVVIPMKK